MNGKQTKEQTTKSRARKLCSSGNMQHPSCRDRSHRRKGELTGKTLRSQTEGRQPQSEGADSSRSLEEVSC